MHRRTVEWLLFLLLLALGAAGGLAWAWLAAPARPDDAAPAALNAVDRAIYLRLVADNFAADGDEARAAARLAALGPDAAAHLVALLAADLRDGRGSPQTGRLATLAAALEIDAPEVALLAPPRPLPAATPQAISALSATPTNTPAGRYELIGREALCTSGEAARRIEVIVSDSDSEPLTGVAITVMWDGGQDTFITGFAAGENSGKADFEMTAGESYSVRVGDDAPAVTDLAIQPCPDGQNGGWQLTFRERVP